ncbi:MAG: dihydrofolate synthase/folylpolyglutamate synthase [Salibacteraceae bacterium]|jgi:dihydrofolate synthase/folylpolyglutamate synthase
MTYQETLDYLFTQLPMYQRQGKAAYKADLSNTIALCAKLGNPERWFKSVHVAGTNGKGSTSHFVASTLQEAGYKVGLYTSPHLIDFRERIRVNGAMIPEQLVVDFVAEKTELLSDLEPSFFEWTVGLAFHYFAKQEVDIAIIETGLGGRLDSTNVINPLISVITNIGLDHTQFLGETLPLIATEKAGIIKDGTPVVIGETQEDILHVFLEKAKLRGAKIVFADQQSESIALSGLVDYQRKNAQTAVVAIKELRAYGFEISNNHLVKGIENMVRNTGLRGRWEIIGNKPLVIADTAHNKEGLIYTMKQLLDLQRTTIRMVFGMVDDKNTDAIMGLLPKDAVYYLCEPSIPRAKPIQELVELFDKEKLNKKIFSSVSVALNAAIADSQEDDVVYVGGSTFVVADALKNY